MCAFFTPDDEARSRSFAAKNDKAGSGSHSAQERPGQMECVPRRSLPGFQFKTLCGKAKIRSCHESETGQNPIVAETTERLSGLISPFCTAL